MANTLPPSVELPAAKSSPLRFIFQIQLHICSGDVHEFTHPYRLFHMTVLINRYLNFSNSWDDLSRVFGTSKKSWRIFQRRESFRRATSNCLQTPIYRRLNSEFCTHRIYTLLCFLTTSSIYWQYFHLRHQFLENYPTIRLKPTSAVIWFSLTLGACTGPAGNWESRQDISRKFPDYNQTNPFTKNSQWKISESSSEVGMENLDLLVEPILGTPDRKYNALRPKMDFSLTYLQKLILDVLYIHGKINKKKQPKMF